MFQTLRPVMHPVRSDVRQNGRPRKRKFLPLALARRQLIQGRCLCLRHKILRRLFQKRQQFRRRIDRTTLIDPRPDRLPRQRRSVHVLIAAIICVIVACKLPGPISNFRLNCSGVNFSHARKICTVAQ